MRTINSLFTLESHQASPTWFYYRRRKALAAASATKKKPKSARHFVSTTRTPSNEGPVESASRAASSDEPLKPSPPTTTTTPTTAAATATATATTTTCTALNNTVTTTNHETRLHLVLQRKTKQQLANVPEELRAHAGVKTVCVYTDSPLVSRAPLSQRQQRILLTSMSEACTCMTALQLDFSSEFGPQTEVILDCELLSTILLNAEQLESLLLKDVSLKGGVQALEKVLIRHNRISKIELKWCTEVPDEANAEPSILSSLIDTFTQMSYLQELTLLLSAGYNLPLPELAKSGTLKRLTLGLEQRYVGHVAVTNTVQSAQQRHAEQSLLVQFLQELKHNATLEECTLFSHHWKSSMTLDCVCDIVDSSSSALKHLSLTDYNYGSDDPRKLLELAAALQTNTKLQSFKLITKKRVSSAVDKKTRKVNSCMIDTAFVEALEQNFTLQYLDIVHAGIQVNDMHKSRSACKACGFMSDSCGSDVPAVLEQPHKPKSMIPFYLMTNRHKARQQFLYAETVNHEMFQQFLIRNNDNTPLVYFLLQANPSLLLPALATGLSHATTRKNGQLAGKHIWEYYF